MLGSQVGRCVHCVENVAWLMQHSPHSAHILLPDSPAWQQLQQDRTIGSGTQSDLLMMGIKLPEICWDTI